MDEQRKVMTGILIEKAEAIEAIKGAFEYPEYYGTAIRLAVNAIKKIPTIEAKPVIHAHWTGSDGTHCSHCKRSYMDVADADSWESSDIPDFCPYCGAQMDEKED